MGKKQNQPPFEKIPFEESKKALNKYGNNYSDEEIREIVNFLYLLADIDYENFLKFKEIKEELLPNKKIAQNNS